MTPYEFWQLEKYGNILPAAPKPDWDGNVVSVAEEFYYEQLQYEPA